MIEEILGLFLSVISLFTSDSPQLSQANNEVERDSTLEESEENGPMWRDKIHREYKRERQFASHLTDYYTSPNYVSIGSESQITHSLWQSIWRSLQANITIIVAVFPIGLIGIAVLYLDLNSTDLCLQWKHKYNSVPLAAIRWNLIGLNVLTTLVNLWFPITLVMLFGWAEFRSNHILTLYVGYAIAATVVIYLTFLHVFGVFETNEDYRYAGNVMFVVGIIWNSVLVARKIRHVYPSVTYSTFHIVTVISFDFIAGFAIAMLYRYAIVPQFIKLESQSYKALMAAIVPVLSLLPTATCKYIVLRRSSEIIEPQRSFLLIYFLHGTTISLYRFLQADFDSIWLFIALSLLSGFSNVGRQATKSIREKIWTRLTDVLRKTCCCKRLEQLAHNTPHQRRLQADTEIQDMLFEYITLIMSQIYIVFYRITSFEISIWPVLKESLVRICIGVGIDFVFNYFSILIQIHWHDIPIRRVLLKYWKRHIIANAMILTVIVSYFTPVILPVFQARSDKSGESYNIRNCSLPFTNW